MEEQKKPDFSIGEAVSAGYNSAKTNLFFFIVLYLLLISISIVYFAVMFGLIGVAGNDWTIVMQLVNWLFSSILSLGMIRVMLNVLDGKKPAYKEVFFTNWRLLFVYIVSGIFRQIAVVVGFLCFIIPGIILSIKLQYIEYFIVDKKMEFEAINKSWEITKGVKLKLFFFGFVLGLINLLGVLALILGLFFTIPLTMLANTYVYRKLSSNTL